MQKNLFIEKIAFENYCGSKNVSINNLSQVNLFIGRNGAGKSNILNAIRYLTSWREESPHWATFISCTYCGREYNFEKNCINITPFHRIDDNVLDNYDYNEEIFSSISSLMNQTELSENIWRKEIIFWMKRFKKDIVDIEIENDTVYLKTLYSKLPIGAYGSGLSKILYILTYLLNKREHVVFIESLFNDIHYSTLHEFSRMVLFLSHKYDIQIFCTSHNVEGIDILAEVSQSYFPDDDLLRIIKVKKTDNKTETKSYSGRCIYENKSVFESELRS